MFDVGFAEIFLLALIGLLVLGPERLPAVARTLGGFMRKARASWASLRTTIESELADADITAPIKEAREELTRMGKDLKSDLPDFKDIPGFTPENRETDDTGNSGVSGDPDSGKKESQPAESDKLKDSDD